MSTILNFDHQIFQFINSLAGQNVWLDGLAIFCAQYLIFIIGAIVSFLIFKKKEEKKIQEVKIFKKRAWFFPAGSQPQEVVKPQIQPQINNKLVVLQALLAAIFSYFTAYFVKFIHLRKRPFTGREVIQLLENPLTSQSFPSGHTTLAFALAFTIYFYHKRLGSFLLFLAFLVGFGRVLTGVHYPIDILGGILIGFFGALILKFVLSRYGKINPTTN